MRTCLTIQVWLPLSLVFLLLNDGSFHLKRYTLICPTKITEKYKDYSNAGNDNIHRKMHIPK